MCLRPQWAPRRSTFQTAWTHLCHFNSATAATYLRLWWWRPWPSQQQWWREKGKRVFACAHIQGHSQFRGPVNLGLDQMSVQWLENLQTARIQHLNKGNQMDSIVIIDNTGLNGPIVYFNRQMFKRKKRQGMWSHAVACFPGDHSSRETPSNQS